MNEIDVMKDRSLVPDADIECAPAVPLTSNIPNPVDNQNTRTTARLSDNFPSKRSYEKLAEQPASWQETRNATHYFVLLQ